MLLLDAANWQEVPTVVLQLVAALFSMGSTKVIEDAFHILRVLEQRGQSSNKVSCQRAWHCLLSSSLMTSRHQIHQVDYRSVGLKRLYTDVPRVLGSKVHKPSTHTPRLPLHKVTGLKDKVLSQGI